MVVKKYVLVNEHGRRIGKSHPRARLTDREVALIGKLAEGLPDILSFSVNRKPLYPAAFLD